MWLWEDWGRDSHRSLPADFLTVHSRASAPPVASPCSPDPKTAVHSLLWTPLAVDYMISAPLCSHTLLPECHLYSVHKNYNVYICNCTKNSFWIENNNVSTLAVSPISFVKCSRGVECVCSALLKCAVT